MAGTVVEGDHAGTLATPLRAELSGTSWGAIVGGAVGATVVALVLILLGSGMGLTAISPWGSSGISAEAIGAWTIAWLVVTQWIASSRQAIAQNVNVLG